jgi:hypothetical protein
MADENNTPKSSPEYAMLPAGTVVKFGEVGPRGGAQTLINCKALGATGQTGGFVDCTTLLDKSKQSVSDLPEGPEKSLGFIDDPENEDFTAFLNAAEQRKTVQFYIELPNKRTASMILALSGWQMNEITALPVKLSRLRCRVSKTIKWGSPRRRQMPARNPFPVTHRLRAVFFRLKNRIHHV